MIDLVLFILACVRITELIVYDNGPFNIFLNFREWTDGLNDRGIFRTFNYALYCAYCTGIWVAVFLVLGQKFIPYFEVFVLIAAIAGGQSLIEKVKEKLT